MFACVSGTAFGSFSLPLVNSTTAICSSSPAGRRAMMRSADAVARTAPFILSRVETPVGHVLEADHAVDLRALDPVEQRAT